MAFSLFLPEKEIKRKKLKERMTKFGISFVKKKSKNCIQFAVTYVIILRQTK